jgi:peptide-methionine (S)-S-oxide reductase
MRFSAVLSLVYCLVTPVALTVLTGCSSATNSDAPPVSTDPALSESVTELVEEVTTETVEVAVPEVPKQQTATFGAGCFWCVEAVFEQLKSVENVRSGYTGGTAETASYYVVSEGTTGHAEVIQFEFDPSVISYQELLEVFWTSHDPTTLNQQGADRGTQYRSAIFYHSDEQRDLAIAYKKRLNDEKAFGDPVVTEIVPFVKFYTAEGDHQDYFALNGTAPYCQRIIRPKVEKVRKVFADKLK